MKRPAFLTAAAAALLAAATASAQTPTVEARIVPDSIGIGDTFTLEIDVERDQVQVTEFPLYENDDNEHLGIAVKSLEEAIPFWENILGFKCYSIEEVADQKVKTAFFKVGQTKIELLEPTSEESTIAKFIANRGEGVHHVAYAVENIEEALAEAESKGVRLIDKTPRRGAEGLTIAFLHPKSTGGVLTELCEDKNGK